MQLLDIGCGWGGFAQFAASRYDVRVTGISPAIEQVTLARENTVRLPVTILQKDYLEGEFDRITSIGMMEHVGPHNLGTFFETCDRLLVDDGMMLHHTIGSNEKTHTDPWFDKYIFPGGVLPSLGQISRAAEKVWSIEDVHNFGPDYDRTLMAWRQHQRPLGRDPALRGPFQADVGVLPARIGCRLGAGVAAGRSRKRSSAIPCTRRFADRHDVGDRPNRFGEEEHRRPRRPTAFTSFAVVAHSHRPATRASLCACGDESVELLFLGQPSRARVEALPPETIVAIWSSSRHRPHAGA